MFIFNVTDATGAISGYPHVRVYDSRGRLKSLGGTAVGTVTSVGLSMPNPAVPAFTVTGSPVTTSGVLTVTANGTVTDYIDGTGALQPFPTIITYTVDNGLTENPAGNFQLGGTLIQNTTITGANFNFTYTGLNRYLVDVDDFVNISSASGSDVALVDVSTGSATPYVELNVKNGTNTHSIYVDDTQIILRTPGVDTASVLNGDVLTLIDAASGEVEFQTPTASTLGLQDVIINDPALTQNNNIDGGNFNLNFNNNNQFNVISDQFITLTSDNGTTDSAAVEINTQGAEPFVDIQVKNGVDTIGITVDTAAIFLRTPGIDGGTALLGDVLTLIDPVSGEAEFQTPTGGTASLPYGLATQSPAGVYTATIAGVTSLTAGDVFIIKFDSENDGASTLNINALGAIDIFKNTDVKIASGDIKTNQTIELVYDGTNFQAIGLISSQLVAYVHNAEGAVITKGQVVYAYQASGDKMSVKLARADTDATSAKTIGLVYDASIGIGGEGYIIIQGVIEGINTAAFSAGDTLYLSGTTYGAATNVKPYAPIHLVYVGIVERANAGNGQIYVRCQNGYELDEIHDVDLITTPPVNNDVLVFDTSTTPDLWVAKSIPTILGFTPAAADLPEISVSTANAREDNYTPTGWPGTSNIVKVIKINSTNTDYMTVLGGLSNPVAGRIVTIYNNSSANNLIIIEHLSPSSTAANRFRMAGSMPYFLLPNRSVTFLYDGTYWTQFSASSPGGLDFFDDCTGGGSGFVTTSSVGLCGVHASGTGAGARGASGSSTDTIGEYSIVTGTTTTGFAAVSQQVRRAGGNGSLGGSSSNNTIPYITVGKILMGSLATVAQDFQVHFGMNGVASLPANAPTIGYLWYYPGSGSSVWHVRSANTGGTTTQVATAITVTTGYIWLGVYKPGGSTVRDAVYFYSTDGITYQMVYKFVGAAGAYGGSPTAVIGAIAGTTSKELNVDWIGSSLNLTR